MARALHLHHHHPRAVEVVVSLWLSLLLWSALFWAGGLLALFADLQLGVAAFAPLWLQVIGLVLSVLGLVLVALSAHWLLRLGGSQASSWFGHSDTLVQEGVYGLVRHPMYLGFIALAYGYGLLLNSVTFTVAVATLVALALSWKAHREDRQLVERHGKRFHAYRERTRGFLPVRRRSP
ncbi:MAG: isoprenylcysteine carboxylmethyltransferase family protein [Candidatus Kerfeldbacteria bacterium]|nr:isoprenylcysteine carboxylmethyltransferase family protein [Candidatus Kerfeldbacteria bacterium]